MNSGKKQPQTKEKNEIPIAICTPIGYTENEVVRCGRKTMKMEEAEEAIPLFGKYRHTLDSKGRLVVPAKLREELGECFYVTIGIGKCLSVYPEHSWSEIMERYNAMPLSRQAQLRYLMANVAECAPDKQGRFLIPQELRQIAGIDQEVTFVGQGAHAEVWDTATYNAEESKMLLSPEKLMAAMEELGF